MRPSYDVVLHGFTVISQAIESNILGFLVPGTYVSASTTGIGTPISHRTLIGTVKYLAYLGYLSL
jgi:hypothetical protein